VAALKAANPNDASIQGAYSAVSTCATNVIVLANHGAYQQAITATVGSGATVGQGGCEPAVGKLRADLLNIASADQSRFDQDMTSVGSEYAGAAAFPLALGAGILGAVAAAYGVNRRLAEFR
jgi:hypothetical protein